jgi:exopolysaccharide production protein ExoQ
MAVANASVGRRAGAAERSQRWPMLCVLALVVVSDFQFRLRSPQQTLGGSPDLFVALEVATYAGVGAFLLVRFGGAPRLRRPDVCAPLVYAAYGYAVILLFAAAYSPYLMLAMVRAGQVVVVVALFMAIVRHARSAAAHLVAHGYVVLIALSVVFGVVVPFPRLPTQPDRFTWLHVHPVQAGEMLAIAVVLAAAYVVTFRLRRAGPRWPLASYLLLLAVCAVGLVATNTRGAMLGALVGLSALVWVRWRGTRRVEVGALAALVAAIVALTSWSAIESFFVRGESAERLATLNARTHLWEAAYRHIADNVLYGSGLAASRGLFLDTLGLGGGHNALVNVLVEIGVVGALVWLAFLLAVLVAALRLTRASTTVRVDGIIAVALLSGMIVNSIFTEELGSAANVAFTWLYALAAWMVVATRTVRGDAADAPNA